MYTTYLLKLPFLFVTVLTIADVAIAQTSYTELRRHVISSVRRGHISVDEPTFDWSGDYMIYDLSPACDANPEQDPMEQPFAELLTVAAIRKYRMRYARQRQFWEGVLPEVEREIEGMVNTVHTPHVDRDHFVGSLRESSNRIAAIYSRKLDELAQREGKKGARTEKPCAIYIVSARAEPANATVKYMRSGAYLLHKCFHDGLEPSWNDDKWQTAPAGGKFTIGEKTRFRVRWTNGRETSELIPSQRDGRSWTLVARLGRGFSWERTPGN